MENSVSTKVSRRNVALAVVGGVLGIAVGLGGLATAREDSSVEPEMPLTSEERDALSSNGSEPVSYVEDLSGGSPGLSPEAAADAALKALPESAGVYDVQISAAPESALDPTLPWVDVYIDGPATDGDGHSVALTWKASLVQGAMADLMRTHEIATNHVLGGSRVFVRNSEGQVRELDGGGGFVAAGQVFAAQQDGRDETTIATSVSTAVGRFGLVPKSIEVLRPFGPAVSVVATLPADVPVDWTIDDLRAAITDTPIAYEGVSITILDVNGRPLLVSGVAYRTGLGGLWFAEGQDTRFGALHGGNVPHG